MTSGLLGPGCCGTFGKCRSAIVYDLPGKMQVRFGGWGYGVLMDSKCTGPSRLENLGQQNGSRFSGVRVVRNLEREGEASAQIARGLGEEQQRTVAQDVWLVALCKQVLHV